MADAVSPGVVVHLDEADPGKHHAVLRNVRNLMDALGPETHIELVTHGPGISILLEDSPQREAVQALHDQGLVVTACRNTLRSEDIPPERLVPGAVIVPSGIAHLVLRQREGWSYVRP
jgi:intracellular sulfur oxidation DsrE/DsrF family protein